MEQKNEIQKQLGIIHKEALSDDLYGVTEALEKAFNLGVQMSADNADIKASYNDVYEQWSHNVDKESILKLLIK
jgi:hypothetical protein